MPIVEVEVVCRSEAEFGRFSAAALADALGRAFGSQPGTAWVKLRLLGSKGYAENEVTLGDGQLPAFVSVLHARIPHGEALATEARAVTDAVALCLGRAPGRVHVRYEPSASGRQAFGGSLVG
jgi:phenylpyruvate tautomerase PptA (4-oxalocrotonate tautomerase family)